MHEIDLLIFDFDGTLVSSGEDIASSVNHMLRKLGLPEHTEQEIISFVGDGTDKLIERAIGKASAGLHSTAVQIFSNHYKEHLMDGTKLYPGARDVLTYFSAKKKLIVTNKLYQFTIQIAQSLDILNYFNAVIARDNYPFCKPDYRLLISLVEEYGVTPDRTAVVGDGINDILLAKQAGAWSCAVLNGLTPRETLLKYKPDFACENLSEIKSIFD